MSSEVVPNEKEDEEVAILDILSKVFKLDEEEICLNEEKQKQLTKHAKSFWILEGLIRCLSTYFQDDSSYEQHLEHIYGLLDASLNTGHFSEVPDVYRLLFSVCCLIQTFILWKSGKSEEALAKCDEGLLKGYELDENVLGELGEILSDHMGPMEKIEFPSHLSHNPPAPLSTTRKISVLNLPSLETFYTNAFLPEKPVIIRGLLSNMPCYKKWSFDYLYNKCGRRIVPVEIGSKYTDEDWSQILMPFGQFLNDFVANEENAEEPGYMAQHRLLDQVPSLLKDIIIPDYCSLVSSDEPENINCFIGPSSTVSPLHTDPRHNFFFQVRIWVPPRKL
uniref:Cupin_8 domain-containing protein n=1 Tax=Bursaphelenchus xylophilus TaxID=6326 RepID=A0A1I7RWN6_BURXY